MGRWGWGEGVGGRDGCCRPCVGGGSNRSALRGAGVSGTGLESSWGVLKSTQRVWGRPGSLLPGAPAAAAMACCARLSLPADSLPRATPPLPHPPYPTHPCSCERQGQDPREGGQPGGEQEHCSRGGGAAIAGGGGAVAAVVGQLILPCACATFASRLPSPHSALSPGCV